MSLKDSDFSSSSSDNGSAAEELKVISGEYLLTVKGKGRNEFLTGEEQNISDILDKDVVDQSADAQGTSRIYPDLITTTTITIEETPPKSDGDWVKVKLASVKGYQSSLTTLEFVVCEDEEFFDKKVIKEVDSLYRRVYHAILEADHILSGNVAVAFNKETSQYCRVRIMSDFISRKKKVVCKLLDDFGELNVYPDDLLQLFRYYGKFPPKVKHVRLEHLRHYDNYVLLKPLLTKRLYRKSGSKNVKEYFIQFTGLVDENQMPIVYLKDEEFGKESINRTIMDVIVASYQDYQLFSKIGDNLEHLNVTHMLLSGRTYLQNKQSPMNKHLEALLALFPSRKDQLVAMDKKNVTYDDFYLTLDSDGQAHRVEVIPPQTICEFYDYDNGVCVDFSDNGARPLKPIPVSNLYLASDLDPILGNFPRQCHQVKLFKVPPLKPYQVPLARSLFPADDLFSAVAAGKEVESGCVIFCVELYNEKTSKFYVRDIQQGDGSIMSVTMRSSVNVEFLKIVSDEKRIPISFTLLKPSNSIPNFLTFKPQNPALKKGKKVNVFIDSIYSFDDLTVISEEDLEQRRNMEQFFLEYKKGSLEREWTRVDEMYVYDNPDALYVVPMNTDAKTMCRAVVVKGRIDPNELVSPIPVVQVLLLDYAVFRVVGVDDLDVLCMPQYCVMPPLAACASVNGQQWEKKTKKTFPDFKAMTESIAAIKIHSVKFDNVKRMWLTVSFVDKETKPPPPPEGAQSCPVSFSSNSKMSCHLPFW